MEPSVEMAQGSTQPHVPTRRSYTRSPWLLGGIPLAMLLIAAWLVRFPYYLVSPGTAPSIIEHVKIDGAEVFEPEGEVLYTTVSVSLRRINGYELLAGWLDDDIEIVEEELITGGLSRSTVRTENRVAIDISKLIAEKIALERLGYTVAVASDGVRIVEVAKGQPSEALLAVDDLVRAIDGVAVATSEEAVAAVRKRRPGDEIRVRFSRDGNESEVAIRAAEAEEPGKALIGVRLFTENPRFDLPFQIDIDTGRVGGPSAGLAFTLALLDLLTPGELSGGLRVAVTGTIDIDGSVGVVDGVEHKAAAARRENADIFLVPIDRLDEARSRAGRMRVFGVSNLDDALKVLEKVGGEPLPPEG